MSFLVTRRAVIDAVTRACMAVSLGLVTDSFAPLSAHAASHRHICRPTATTGIPSRARASTPRTCRRSKP